MAADSVYGVGETALRKAGKGYVLGVTGKHHVRSWGKAPVVGTADEIAATLEASDWKRLSAGDATKGARLHDWAYMELADLDAAGISEGASGAWTRGLLIRRNIADGDLAFFTTWCAAGTTIDVLVQVEDIAGAIEDSFDTAKNELGLDHNETRSWRGWHRHVSLVMLAFAMMAVIRYKANAATPPKRSLEYPLDYAVPDPLVCPGNPADRHPPRPTPNPARSHPRLVAVATNSPSFSTPGPSQDTSATVMLGPDRMVDYLVASHVVEHIPDLVSWFGELSSVLKPGGTVRLAVPDRRFCFDYRRAESQVADVLTAHLVRARRPQPREIIDFYIHLMPIDAGEAWDGSAKTAGAPWT